MFLAPLNYDRFFKKVFKDLNIAKNFIEDFLEIEIESIETLYTTQRFTDAANIVEFDYRCKVDGQYMVIDMQQWYKPDVTQRFFLYHCLNTGLQLEALPEKKLIIDKTTGKAKAVKDYRRLEPVLTLIWMVTDNLGFAENYISYRLRPDTVIDFINDNKLWKKPLNNLLKERATIQKHIKHKTKDIDFLAKNTLTFMFQKNIVKDEKIKKYHRWFEFAEKTRDEDNKEEDFTKFRGDKVFEEIISRIDQSKLKPEELEYIKIQHDDIDKINRWEQGIRAQSKRDGIGIGEERGLKKAKIEVAIKLKRKDYPVEDISELTGLSIEEIEHLPLNEPQK